MKPNIPSFVGWFIALTISRRELRRGITVCNRDVPAFTVTFNNSQGKGQVPGGKVVAIFNGGSADIPQNASRVEDFARTLQE